MTDGGLSFYYHISGDIETEVSLSTISKMGVPSWKYQVYTPTEAGLTFWYHVSGNITESLTLQTQSSISLAKQTKKTISIPLKTVSHLAVWKQVRYLCQIEIKTVSTLTPQPILNAGYLDIIQFGDLVLTAAKPKGDREYSFPCAQKRLLDGSLSLHVRNNLSYVGEFNFATDSYQDVQDLMKMVGSLQTLRVYGVPYRNCMIWSPIKLKQPKAQFSRYWVGITIYQDTSKTSITS